MRALKRFFARFRNFATRRSGDARLREEMEQHLAMQTEENIRSGMSPAEASRQARLKYGAVESIREDYHKEEGLPLLENLMHDTRFTFRILSKSPGFAVAAVLTLALGIGACTAIFSAVDPILLQPLPYPHANQILTIWGTFKGERSRLAFGNWRELEERNHSFEALAVYEPWQPVLLGSTQPVRLNGQKVSASYLRVLGIEPWLGRDFLRAEDTYHGPTVAILSYRLWQQRFGGERKIIGAAVTLDGDRYTVIGVMPAGFENVLSSQADIWTPLDYDVQTLAADFDSGEWGNHLYMVGRVRPGVSREAATQDLESIAANRIAQFPRPPHAALGHGLIVDSLQADVTREVRPALLAVMGAVVLLLLMAGVNVTNLQMARGAQRQSEFAMRVTLGAGRIRLVRQLITESLLLAGLGDAAGVAIAAAGVRLLVAMSPPELPRIDAVHFSVEAFLFALALTALVGGVTGLVPALSASREELPATKQNSARSTRSTSWTRRTLVVTEMALALILLAGAGLLLRSMEHLLVVDPGFNPSDLLTVQIKTSGHEFDDTSAAPRAGSDARRRFFEQALDAARRVPGVMASGLTTNLPLSLAHNMSGVFSK